MREYFWVFFLLNPTVSLRVSGKYLISYSRIVRVRRFTFGCPCPEKLSTVSIYSQPYPVLWSSCLYPACRPYTQCVHIYKVYIIIHVGGTEQDFPLKQYFWLLWMVWREVLNQTNFTCASHFPPHVQALRRKIQLTLILLFLFFQVLEHS